MFNVNFSQLKQINSNYFAKGVDTSSIMQEQDKPLLSFKDDKGRLNQEDKAFKIDENSNQYKSDAQQLNEDALWLSELYQGVQAGEDWAIEEAKKLQVAAAPDKNDNSSNAQLLRSNNDLASAIKAMVISDRKEK